MTGHVAEIIALYRRHAAAWDAARRELTPVEARWLSRFLALLPPKARVLDIGCGTGRPIGKALVAKGHHLTGLDTSPELLAIARQTVPTACFIEADMREFRLDQTFDGLIAWHSSFHLTPEDQAALFPTLAQHAAPGAVLMFTSGPEAGTAMGTFEGEPLYHSSLAPDDYRELLSRNGFAEIRVETVPGGPTVWMARNTGATGRR